MVGGFNPSEKYSMKKHEDIHIYIYMVGGLNPSEKYEFVTWDDDIPN